MELKLTKCLQRLCKCLNHQLEVSKGNYDKSILFDMYSLYLVNWSHCRNCPWCHVFHTKPTLQSFVRISQLIWLWI